MNIGHTEEDKRVFITVLANKNFNISAACRAFKISRWTYYEWLKEPWFAQEIKELEEAELDLAEEMHRYLRNGIPKIDVINGKKVIAGWYKEPDRNALEFYLRTKGKVRGYQDKGEQQQQGNNGKIVIVRIPDNGRDPGLLGAGQQAEYEEEE